eukprot:jgi/Mesen1/2582/ME000164S01710
MFLFEFLGHKEGGGGAASEARRRWGRILTTLSTPSFLERRGSARTTGELMRVKDGRISTNQQAFVDERRIGARQTGHNEHTHQEGTVLKASGVPKRQQREMRVGESHNTPRGKSKVVKE